jgi:asparagine synthase (glutamine-hydrolysing)
MCGIAGLINAPGSREEQTAWMEAMLAPLAHRGPDDQGLWLGDGAVLGHRRLSIIDLEGGHQPLLDAQNQAVVVFNGEIYNFPELRRSLEGKGFHFRTQSDTEVLLNAYLDRGARCLDDLEGMFAFAIWHRPSRTLFAARDRMGKKPFYYTLQDGVFAFASELSALERLPLLRLEINRQSLVRFLAYEYVPTPRTIYHGVHKLRPGHFLEFSRGNLHTAKYWEIPAPAPDIQLSQPECEAELRRLLDRAVARRLISDVPLGIFLSGGLDSSSIVAAMAAACPAAAIKTFSIAFREPDYDESPYSRLVARRFGTDHHEEQLSAYAAGTLLPDIVSRQDEPLADPAVIPTFLLSRLARSRITVALSGDGADELFGGYQALRTFKYAPYYEQLPQRVKRLVEGFKPCLPVSDHYVSLGREFCHFLTGMKLPPWLRLQVWTGGLPPELQETLWLDSPPRGWDPEEIYAETLSLYQGFAGREPLEKAFFLYARQFLLDRVLVKVDRISMMNSLEVRAPFLDRELMEFAFRLPAAWKIKGFSLKYILKKAMAPRLPRSIVRRPKRGFMIPTARYLKENLRDRVEEFLGETHLTRQGLFRPQAVRRLWREHQSGRQDYRRELWTLLVLQLWLHYHPYPIR